MDSELELYDNDDLQHDLAAGLANGESLDDPLNSAIYEILVVRGALIPVNCRYEYNTYAYLKMKLCYDLTNLKDIIK